MYERSKPVAMSLIHSFRETWGSQEELLQYLDKTGIAINDKVTVHSVEPYDRSHCISINHGKEIFISEHVAKNILVMSK